MADITPKYANIIDEFLEDREPDWKELGLKDAQNSGEDQLDRTHKYVDEDFIDEIAEGASRHTPVPANSKGATLRNRMMEKESANPVLGIGSTANAHLANHAEDYKNSIGDNKSLLDEVTMTLESAEKSGVVEKKERTDAEIQRYIKTLLNEGVPPSKVATQLAKLAEVELFNRQMSTNYLQQNAGLVGMAYLEPNTYMDKSSPTYERKMGSNACVAQHTAWKNAGIAPRAKSVKQVAACEGCQYFNKSGVSKTCNLYHLPVVGNKQELSGIVNKMTAGVPAGSKKAALVQIANREGEKVSNATESSMVGRVATFTHERAKGFAEPIHIGGGKIQKLHVAGHSLKDITKAAEKKYGALETSKALREFVAGLKKDKGVITLAKADADFLKHIGIHNAGIVGGVKCASCSAHSNVSQHKAAAELEGVKLASRTQTFVESTPEKVRASQEKKKGTNFDSGVVEKLHLKGHALDKIFKAGSLKVGSAQATKAVRDFVASLKHKNTKVALSQIDCTFLKNKLGVQNAIVGASKCGSCTYRNGMHCGLTGGTLLSFPGMDKTSSNHKIAADAPVDGRSILKEFDLMHTTSNDISIEAPERAEVEMDSKPNAGEI